MGRNKLERFRQNEENTNVVQPGKAIYEKIKGGWQAFFGNEQPITVELACGRGEFTVGLGRSYKARNFIGVDIKGSRIWKGSTMAIAENLPNVAFLRAQIEQLNQFFSEGEIAELWITFPDPRPKDRDEKRRLTSPRFLDMYEPLLEKGGLVHFKTDNTGLYQYTKEILAARPNVKILKDTDDFYSSTWRDEHLGIQTRYEKMFSEKGETIKYICFKCL
ncbi:MAG: tRNA (guanosine(46)-N7)-methyltransferase TrmB [Lunatimonas sp.]|uniref:tRNA (guanosine(46)-N7)-methyltransferase TrmB n=1 Tax=Lunatimonas sp. TaxID=2060141 RepID=UPI00263BC444|nr:tRNA (guanosine(46)-N7)-methyltransferase TrmB [Lunatimonas sp.]MCC5936670.1 tRNA (guanosine(46)-N7)-methyltransferase TrmB [Lunatimonas sp.]